MIDILTDVVSCQMGSIIGNNVFRADDAPLYKRGYSVLLWLNLLGIVLFVGTKVYYVKRNQERVRVWSAMNDEVRFALCCWFALLTYAATRGLYQKQP